QADLPALLAARPPQAGQHGPWALNRTAHRRAAFGNNHGRKSAARRRLLLIAMRAGELAVFKGRGPASSPRTPGSSAMWCSQARHRPTAAVFNSTKGRTLTAS